VPGRGGAPSDGADTDKEGSIGEDDGSSTQRVMIPNDRSTRARSGSFRLTFIKLTSYNPPEGLITFGRVNITCAV
jgi:hypothetical protein